MHKSNCRTALLRSIWYLLPSVDNNLAQIKSYINSLQLWTFLHWHDWGSPPSWVPGRASSPGPVAICSARDPGGSYFCEPGFLDTDGDMFQKLLSGFTMVGHSGLWKALSASEKNLCDGVIYNKKYIFNLHPYFWHRAPKTQEISSDEMTKVSFVMLISWPLEWGLRWGLAAWRTNHVIRGLELSVPPTGLPGKGEELEVEPTANG